VKFVFDFHRYLNEKNVKLVVVEFINYAIICWDQLVTGMRCSGERSINT
jgi:hypothetical protein